jgi:hypothetical protein
MQNCVTSVLLRPTMQFQHVRSVMVKAYWPLCAANRKENVKLFKMLKPDS